MLFSAEYRATLLKWLKYLKIVAGNYLKIAARTYNLVTFRGLSDKLERSNIFDKSCVLSVTRSCLFAEILVTVQHGRYA